MQNVSYTIEPYTLIDEASATEFYIGMSINGNAESSAVWKIKKIWKDGTVTYSGYPDGIQDFKFVWNNRTEYNYI